MKEALSQIDASIRDVKSLSTDEGHLLLKHDKDQRTIYLNELMEFEQAMFAGHMGNTEQINRAKADATKEKRGVFFWRGLYVGASIANKDEIVLEALRELDAIDSIQGSAEKKTADLLEKNLEPHLKPNDRKYLYINAMIDD